MAKAVFTGKNVRSWTVDESYKTADSWIELVECSYGDNPDRCEILVMASASEDKYKSKNFDDFIAIKVYAYNAVGERSEAAELDVYNCDPDD